MLCRQHYGINRHRLAILISQSYLTLGVGTQPGQHTILAQLGLALHQTVSIVDRCRHQYSSFVTRITKHQALIASANIFVLSLVDTLGNIPRLLANGVEHGAGIAIKAYIGTVVADAGNHIANNLLEIYIGIGAHFSGNNRHAGFDHGLYGNPGVRIVL